MVLSVCQSCLENVAGGGMFRSPKQMAGRNVGIKAQKRVLIPELLAQHALVEAVTGIKQHVQ
jgi:hypothetical protein